jgi:hypothetical protein
MKNSHSGDCFSFVGDKKALEELSSGLEDLEYIFENVPI